MIGDEQLMYPNKLMVWTKNTAELCEGGGIREERNRTPLFGVIRHALRCSNRHFICGEKRDLPGRMTSVVKLDAARSSHSVHERRAAVKAALQMF